MIERRPAALFWQRFGPGHYLCCRAGAVVGEAFFDRDGWYVLHMRPAVKREGPFERLRLAKECIAQCLA